MNKRGHLLDLGVHDVHEYLERTGVNGTGWCGLGLSDLGHAVDLSSDAVENVVE
jgi:hypothetical protein